MRRIVTMTAVGLLLASCSKGPAPPEAHANVPAFIKELGMHAAPGIDRKPDRVVESRFHMYYLYAVHKSTDAIAKEMDDFARRTALIKFRSGGVGPRGTWSYTVPSNAKVTIYVTPLKVPSGPSTGRKTDEVLSEIIVIRQVVEKEEDAEPGNFWGY